MCVLVLSTAVMHVQVDKTLPKCVHVEEVVQHADNSVGNYVSCIGFIN